MSVPNQKTIRIDKGVEYTRPPFLQIADNEWQEAANDLTYSAFKLYLYLSDNKDGYELEFSPQAIVNAGLMTRGTVFKAREELEKKGYLVDGVFYTASPRLRMKRASIEEEINKVFKRE